MRSRLVLGLVALAVVATACGGGGGNVAAKKKKPLVTTTTTRGPTGAPLTGLPDPSGQSFTRPAMAVKIENTPQARPQTGLDQADVVYEEITEAGITRFIAVYNSNVPPVVGPIRSVRIMDPDVIAALGGIFVYSGGIQETVSVLNSTPGVNIIVDTGADPALFRDKTKVAPHNLYGHTDQLLARGGKPVPPPRLFQYLQPGATFFGDGVSSFTVKYDPLYAPTYTWGAATNTWKRSIGLAPFMDTDGKQIAPTNVIVQFVDASISSPEGGNYQTVGNGDAWFFSAGRMVKGKWSRSDKTQVTQFTDATGAPLHLTPGTTWVEFVPILGEVNNSGVAVNDAPAQSATSTTLPPSTPPTTAKR